MMLLLIYAFLKTDSSETGDTIDIGSRNRRKNRYLFITYLLYEKINTTAVLIDYQNFKAPFMES